MIKLFVRSVVVVGCAGFVVAGCSSDETASTEPIIVVETSVVSTVADGGSVGSTVADGGSAVSTVADGGVQTDEEKVAAFSQCMRDSGVEAFEDPKVQADGSVELFADSAASEAATGDPDFNAAYDGCVSLLDGASFAGEDEGAQAEDDLVKLAACLRERGIEVDDPNFDAPNADEVFGADLDPSDPKVNEAVNACSAEVYTATSDSK